MFLYKSVLDLWYSVLWGRDRGGSSEHNRFELCSTGVTIKFHIHGCINSCLMIYVLNATYAVCFNVICNSISSFTMHDT